MICHDVLTRNRKNDVDDCWCCSRTSLWQQQTICGALKSWKVVWNISRSLSNDSGAIQKVVNEKMKKMSLCRSELHLRKFLSFLVDLECEYNALKLNLMHITIRLVIVQDGTTSAFIVNAYPASHSSWNWPKFPHNTHKSRMKLSSAKQFETSRIPSTFHLRCNSYTIRAVFLIEIEKICFRDFINFVNFPNGSPKRLFSAGSCLQK